MGRAICKYKTEYNLQLLQQHETATYRLAIQTVPEDKTTSGQLNEHTCAVLLMKEDETIPYRTYCMQVPKCLSMQLRQSITRAISLCP